MPQKPLARALRRHLKPGYCPQNAAKARGKGAARDLEGAYCLTSLSETRRKSPGKHLAGGQRTCCWAPRMQQKPVARAPRGIWRQPTAARDLEAGYRLTLLSEATRKAPRMPQKPLARALRRHLKPGYCPQNAAKARGKGAARDLEGAYCLTSLSETRRKSPGKRLAGGQRTCCWARLLPPECSKSPWQGRREGFGGSLLPNVAF